MRGRRHLLLCLALQLMRTADAAYFSQFSMREPDHDPCFDAAGRPVRCVPEFINAAFGKPVIASETCGSYGSVRLGFELLFFILLPITCMYKKRIFTDAFIHQEILSSFARLFSDVFSRQCFTLNAFVTSMFLFPIDHNIYLPFFPLKLGFLGFRN